VFDPRQKGMIFEEERTSALPSVGPTLEKRLQSFGVDTVRQMKEPTDKDILKITIAPDNRIGEKRLNSFRTLAEATIPGPPPARVGY
jgi:hypothetical protein